MRGRADADVVREDPRIRAPRTTPSGDARVAARHRILIVDDNEVNVDILEEILADDFELATASSGEEALQVVARWHPDLVLLDIMMDGIDGYETCRRIRAIEKLRNTKVIMVSARAMVQERLEGYEAGADDYVVKPFDDEELLAKVRVYTHLAVIEEVDSLKTELLTRLRQEISSPVSGILNPVRMLLDEPDMDRAEREEWLQMIERSATDVQTLFERVFLLARFRAGEIELARQPVALRELVERAIADARPEAEARQITLELVGDTPPPVRVDIDYHQRALASLLGNAIAHSPAVGTVTITLTAHADAVEVSVRDRGAGLPGDQPDRCFEEFAPASDGPRSRDAGTGLAIAREVFRAHGGSASARNAEDGGAVVSYRLPLDTDASRAA